MLKRILSLTAATAMAASLVTGLTTAPAAADAGTPPTLTTPANGGTMLVDQSRTVALDTSDQTVGENWGLTVNCNVGADMSRSYTVDGSGTWSDEFAAAEPGQQCTVSATNADTGLSHYLGSFAVDESAPALQLNSLTRSSASIYPWVREGYYDNVTFDWEINKPATHAITVRNANSTLVRSATVGGGEGTNSWTWGGYSNAGKPVTPGVYTVKVVATDEDNQKASGTTNITVRRSTVTTSKTVIKNGDNGARAARGSCTATRDSWEQTTQLDCWGGSYARVTYSFTIPSKATNVSWNTSGSHSDLDYCCDGRITRTGSRPRSNLYQVRAQVTGWRAYIVNRAWVHYSVRTPR